VQVFLKASAFFVSNYLNELTFANMRDQLCVLCFCQPQNKNALRKWTEGTKLICGEGGIRIAVKQR